MLSRSRAERTHRIFVIYPLNKNINVSLLFAPSSPCRPVLHRISLPSTDGTSLFNARVYPVSSVCSLSREGEERWFSVSLVVLPNLSPSRALARVSFTLIFRQFFCSIPPADSSLPSCSSRAPHRLLAPPSTPRHIFPHPSRSAYRFYPHNLSSAIACDSSFHARCRQRKRKTTKNVR